MRPFFFFITLINFRQDSLLKYIIHFRYRFFKEITLVS